MGKPCLAQSFPEHPAPAGTGVGAGLGSLERWGSPPLGAPTAVPAQWSDPCDLLLQVKEAYAPNQNYLQRHECFTSPGMGRRVTLTEGSDHPCSPCLCFSHRKQRQHYSHSLQGRRGHLCQRFEAPRWKVPLAGQDQSEFPGMLG